MKENKLSFLAVKPSKSGSFAVQSGSNRAFTLTELILVLAVLFVLGGVLLPALAATHDRGNRAACQFNLRQIAVDATQYAGENNDYVLPAANNLYQLQLQVSQAVANEIGLTTNGASIWTCPNRPGFPLPPPSSGGQWVIGYQYYGGITNWWNNVIPQPGKRSASPVKLSQSKPYWMLAADAITEPGGVGGVWYDRSGNPGWANLPAHHTADSMFPSGGNEVFCDGSVQWIDIHKMYFLHSWSSDGSARFFFIYQDITGDTNWGRYITLLIRAGSPPAPLY